MAIKTFEVTLRVEVETPDKTEPTAGDAYDALKEAADLYGTQVTVCTAAINEVRIDSVFEIDNFQVEE
jgi:hypothetical protein